MARVVLLILFGFVASLYFPESRTALVEAARPALTPLYRWQTQHELGEIAREVQTYERDNYGRLPTPRGFGRWIAARFSADVRTDAWGGEYALVLDRQTFSIVSSGPDGLPRTPDDVSDQRSRLRPGR